MRWGAFRGKRDNKYGNVPTRIDGHLFHSKKEAHRYLELKAMQQGGLIEGLELQPAFDLAVNGVPICRYISDFRYTDRSTGAVVIEDVKGAKTREYELKRRLILACHGIEVRET